MNVESGVLLADYPSRPQQFVCILATIFLLLVGNVALKLEFQFSLSASHATPAIEKNDYDDHYTDNDQPFAQTDFH
ncbi:hypothetical protein FHR87_002369 [Azomonas macrocytogenes]|uniref:Uncharacterized protein n=1 Tax=Azomonas macrocytogenes TaxID=69962 RepID=A0A839T4N4_AZOMA|nr:hypothetical protein [Azomonas macrocytogenes]